jgi:hypothetical protein
MNLYQSFAGTRLGHRGVFVTENFRTAVLIDAYGFHRR